MARKKKVAGNTAYGVPQNVTPLLKKQADRLKMLFETADDYPGVQEARQAYQEAMQRQGLSSPPNNLAEADTLIHILNAS